MTMLPSVLSTTLPSQLSGHDELALQTGLYHSVWAPGRLQLMLGMLQVEEVVYRLGGCVPIFGCRVSGMVYVSSTPEFV